MLRSRQITRNSSDMKIGDVEYQETRLKRSSITLLMKEWISGSAKVLADEFKVRIEMRQIEPARAGRIIGACGRELRCATFITNFISVTTTHKISELSLNPQKLGTMRKT